MTTHLRYALGAALGSLICTALATALVLDDMPGLGAIVLGTAVLLAWDTRREAALHRRRLAEHDLARRRADGETVPALTPCCLLHRASKGQAHDHRCTLPNPARIDARPIPDRTHTWDGTRTLPDWLAPTHHHWDNGLLTIHTPDGTSQPKPGWTLIHWTDDTVTVASPHISARVYGVDGPWARAARAEAALTQPTECPCGCGRPWSTGGRP